MKKKRNIAARAALVQAWQTSNQTKLAFCREHHIAKSTFYKWQKELRRQATNNTNTNTSNNTNATTDQSIAIKFLSVQKPTIMSNSSHNNQIEINLPNGCQLKTSLAMVNVKLILQELLQWK